MHNIKINMLLYIDDLEQQLTGSESFVIGERALFEISNNYHTAAISVLLSEANKNEFVKYLEMSAKTRIKLLEYVSSNESSYSRFECASYVEPFFDAIAADANIHALNIAKISPASWNEKDEYEDDYCYASLLYRFYLNECRSSEKCESLLKQFEDVLDGDFSPRFQICKSLLMSDQNDFEIAFDQLIEERETYFEEREGRLQSKLQRFETEKRIFVEGMALAKIGSLSGLFLKQEYISMPILDKAY